jgi:hypothetical protein
MNKNMKAILEPAKSREELLKQWGPKDIDYDNGIDYVPVAAPSGAEGLTALELLK